MVHIRKIKTMYGTRYAVVDTFTHYSPKLDKLGKVVKNNGKADYNQNVSYHAVEYGTGNNIKVAIFPLTKEGLAEAKQVQALFIEKVGAN